MYKGSDLDKDSLVVATEFLERVSSPACDLHDELFPAPAKPCSSRLLFAPCWAMAPTRPNPLTHLGLTSQIKEPLPSALPACTLGSTQPSTGQKPFHHYCS